MNHAPPPNAARRIADDRIARARAVPIEVEAQRHGFKLKRQGSELVGPCPRCGGHDRFSISVRKQVFNCRGCGVGGDVIALVQHLDACDFRTAVTTLTGDLAGLSEAKRQATAASSKKAPNDQEEQRRKAAWLWSQRRPIAEGTPPWLYLRKRGYAGAIPATLGYLSTSDEYPPAMIAAFGIGDEPEPGIIAPPTDVSGVHITRLTPQGDKAAIDRVKIMLGPSMGLPIVLAPPNDLLGLAVTEGIEDGLSVHGATGLGAWAAGSADRMPALADAIPGYVECVTIFAHRDANSKGQRGALALAKAISARGIEVLIEGIAP